MAKTDPEAAKRQRHKTIRWVVTVFLITVVITRYVSLGSLLAAASLPACVYFLGDILRSQSGLGPVFYLSVFVAVLIIVRHHANIVRLLRGKESKLNLRTKNRKD